MSKIARVQMQGQKFKFVFIVNANAEMSRHGIETTTRKNDSTNKYRIISIKMLEKKKTNKQSSELWCDV